jgi:hypothetical protein
LEGRSDGDGVPLQAFGGSRDAINFEAMKRPGILLCSSLEKVDKQF